VVRYTGGIFLAPGLWIRIQWFFLKTDPNPRSKRKGEKINQEKISISFVKICNYPQKKKKLFGPQPQLLFDATHDIYCFHLHKFWRNFV
jgi:hypothetical protein